MNNARTIAALEKTIAQLSAIKDRLAAADVRPETTAIPVKEPAAKKFVAQKAPATKKAAKKTA